VNLCEAIEKGQVDRHWIVKGTVYYINDSNGSVPDLLLIELLLK
jgi:hypothetical protein